MKKVHLGVIAAGAAVGLAALILTALGNPANMGFCIACFLRDISGMSAPRSSVSCSARSL